MKRLSLRILGILFILSLAGLLSACGSKAEPVLVPVEDMEVAASQPVSFNPVVSADFWDDDADIDDNGATDISISDIDIEDVAGGTAVPESDAAAAAQDGETAQEAAGSTEASEDDPATGMSNAGIAQDSAASDGSQTDSGDAQNTGDSQNADDSQGSGSSKNDGGKTADSGAGQGTGEDVRNAVGGSILEGTAHAGGSSAGTGASDTGRDSDKAGQEQTGDKTAQGTDEGSTAEGQSGEKTADGTEDNGTSALSGGEDAGTGDSTAQDKDGKDKDSKDKDGKDKEASGTGSDSEIPDDFIPQPMNTEPGENRLNVTPDDFDPVDFFNDVMFTGDSVMANYRYSAPYSRKDIYGEKQRWLAEISYAARDAILDGVQKTDPKYDGERRKLWDSIHMVGRKRLLMFFGFNDIGITGVDGFIENYKTLIDKILAKNPDVKIYIVGTTPMRKDMQGKNLNNKNIIKANEKLKVLCEERGYGYIDIATRLMTEDGNLKLEYSDGSNVHLNNDGYKIWNTVLKKYAKEQLMKEYLESMANEEKELD